MSSLYLEEVDLGEVNWSVGS